MRAGKLDPSDDKFLERALAGKAPVIVSGDRELLSIGRYRQMRIHSPARFLQDNPNLQSH